MADLTDWRGNKIEVGSKIVYPGRSGSSMWMTEAIIDDIVYVQQTQYNWKDNTTTTVDVPKLKVIADSKKWVYDQVTKTGEYEPYKRKSTLFVIGRVTVI